MKQLQNGKSVQVAGDHSTAKKINSLLNSPKSRVEGLQLLRSYLPLCPDEDFLQYSVSWMQNCCKPDCLTSDKDFAVHLLADILKKSSTYEQLKKSVSFFITTRYFDFFFKHLIHSQVGWSCTETCMIFYRGACGPFQESLEKQFEKEIFKNEKISATIAYCYALLPSVGGGGNDGVNYKKKWREQFVKFLNICNFLLKNLYADAEEIEEYEEPENFYKNTEYENSTAYLTIQMFNHCSVISWMLLGQYPSLKNIPTDQVFRLICRGLAVTSKTLTCQTTETLSLKEFLPEIHRSQLSVLKALIVTCKNQLLPYAHLVCKLIKQTLESTESEFRHKNEDSLEQLRVSAYEVFCNWLVATRSGSCVEDISSVIISNAANDISPEEEAVFLKEGKQKRNSGKVEKRTHKASPKFIDQIIYAALKSLQFLLKFAGTSLKPEEHKFLQELVVKSIVTVQRSVSDINAPFATPRCRLELYSLLLELVLQPCPKWPPPTHFAVAFFSRGLNDSFPEVSSFCSMALSVTTVIIHPQYSNGGFPLIQGPEKTNEREIQLQWREVSVEEEHDNGEVLQDRVSNLSGEENFKDKSSDAALPTTSGVSFEKNLGDESNASSDEDSRNTVTFSKDSGESNTSNVPNVSDTPMKSPAVTPTGDEPSPKLRKIAEEKSLEPVPENHPLDALSDGKDTETKLTESSQPEPKTVSPESASEEGQLRKRYFLRSKTKGSSEEPEEMLKHAASLDSLKCTPVKSSPRRSPNFLSTTKRPRTRALSRIETKSSTESNTPKGTSADDEEDIIAAFNDSFIDEEF